MRTIAVALAVCAGTVMRAAAQNITEVEALAPLLMAEDRHTFDSDLLIGAVGNPDTLVRRQAALTIGRLGDPRGTRLLAPLLADSDSVVVANAFFAYGLLRDTTGVAAILERLRSPDSLSTTAAREAATALARIGGPTAAQALSGVISGASDVPSARAQEMLPDALLDGWRLGALTPVNAMSHYLTDTSTSLRWRTLYALGRIRAPIAGRAMLNGLRDQAPIIRAAAARAMTRRFADTAGIAASTARTALIHLLDDDHPDVRTVATMSLATFADSADADHVIPLLGDEDPNVRVAAVTALGDLGGAAAVRALDGIFDRHDALWAMRNAALPALARADTARFAVRAAAALQSTDARDRAAAVAAWGAVHTTNDAVFVKAAADADPWVAATALGAWQRAHPDSGLTATARRALNASSDELRTAATDALRSAFTAADIDALVGAWHRAASDPTSDERLAIVNALHTLSRSDPDLLAAMTTPARRDVLQRPDDPVVRENVARTWPALGAIWGDPWPVETHRTLDDYRNIVQTYLLASSDVHVTIDVVNKGSIDLQLLGHEAPLTVANFLRLVDAHYFDGNRWHRVVPAFVVQDGDRTGTGDGGPGWSIRDEINRERYLSPMAGMALSGPNTGGSQWFINLTPQPHLDGQYTIFGKVSGSYLTLSRITQGDVIRAIHR